MTRRPIRATPTPPDLPLCRALEYILRQKEQGEKLLACPPVDRGAASAWFETTRAILVRAFGSDHRNVLIFHSAGLRSVYTTSLEDVPAAADLKERLTALQTSIEQLQLTLEEDGSELQATEHPLMCYYHVKVESVRPSLQPAVRIDMTESELKERILRPREQGSGITIKGRTIPLDEIARLTIRRSSEPASDSLRCMLDPPATGTAAWEELAFERVAGEDVTEDMIVGPPGSADRPALPARAPLLPRPVFIVHGRDQARLHEVARFLERTTMPDVEVTILNEAPNVGQTLIEKLERVGAKAAYAVVLLTGDDEGGIAQSGEHQPRARQNVILELGYFLGKLGRERVAILHEQGVELPSDVHGMAYIQLDPGGGWKTKLSRELAQVGIHLDLLRAP